MHKPEELYNRIIKGDQRSLARAITLVENGHKDAEVLLRQLSPSKNIPVLGITGAPGAGKSTLISALVSELVSKNKKIGIIAVDPTSPFTHGSILGDRVRMEKHFLNDNVFIRSLATRGNLGGLSAKSIEVTDLMRCAGFDYIIVETVGVGQSEMEIVGLADTTILVLVPEGGDEIQTIKSGIMEAADIFVVNKSDRDGAEIFVKNLHHLVHEKPKQEWDIPILKTIATTGSGINELLNAIDLHNKVQKANSKQEILLTEKAYQLIQHKRMRDISKAELKKKIKQEIDKGNAFNLYRFIDNF